MLVHASKRSKVSHTQRPCWEVSGSMVPRKGSGEAVPLNAAAVCCIVSSSLFCWSSLDVPLSHTSTSIHPRHRSLPHCCGTHVRTTLSCFYLQPSLRYLRRRRSAVERQAGVLVKKANETSVSGHRSGLGDGLTRAPIQPQALQAARSASPRPLISLRNTALLTCCPLSTHAHSLLPMIHLSRPPRRPQASI